MSDRTAWLQDRMTAIGASEIPTLFGEGYEGMYSLWSRKCGLADAREETEAMEVGTLIQPVITELLRRRANINVQDADPFEFIRDSQYPFLGCSLDGRAFSEEREGPGIAEIKNVGHYVGSDWKDGVPMRVQLQCQAQMLVTGYDWGVVGMLLGGNKLAHFVVERHEAIQKAIVTQAKKFWKLVESRTPPPVDDSEETARVLFMLHPDDSGDEVPLPSGFAKLDKKLAGIKRRIADLEKKERAIENRLKAEIGAATFGLIPGGGMYSWKTQTRGGYVVQPSKSRVLRRVKSKGSK
jgi:putative phage-type endonuclease